MATVIEPGDKAFLDTSYAVALSAPTDELHGKALSLADELDRSRTRLVTTRAVLLEIGNALSRSRHRAAAIGLLDDIENDPIVDIVPLSEDLYIRALRLYSSRPDKEWGLIDCVSFVVMSEQEMTIALSSDEHFQQCGFRALLRE
jgi:uncharacterized protein